MKPGRHTYLGDDASRQLQLGGSNTLRQARNRAYLLIGLLLVLLLALAIAVTSLAELHTVVPVIAVIDAHGQLIKQQVVSKQTLTGQESFVQSQVYNFVAYCNTFDPAWRQHYADLCRLHASQAIAKQYERETAADNPANPYYLIGPHGKRYPKITGLTALGKDAYQVAFQSLTEQAGSELQIAYFTALIRYTFTDQPLALGDRWENPLGFAVTAYRKDQQLSRQ